MCSPFARLPVEIQSIIFSYSISPIALDFKRDILSYLRIHELIEETPVAERKELFLKVLFWMNIQRELMLQEEIEPIQEINLLLFSSVRPETWRNPVYNRQFHHVYGMPKLSAAFYRSMNDTENDCGKWESKIRIIWGLFCVRERLQFLIVLPYFMQVMVTHHV